MLPQFRTAQPIGWGNVRSGMLLFLWGLFKKQVIADNLSLIANPLFTHPAGLSSGELLVGVLAFSFQIYGDFSGYTDMARGLAKLMGFDLRLNFALPYFARTPQEFWRRWHISLSEWLRDYLYIPLGGSRGGTFKTYRNLMLTMILGGLWHGAAWTFIVWGFIHGLIQVVYRTLGIDDRLNASRGAVIGTFWNVLAWALLMPQIALAWIYFRADGMHAADSIVLGVLRGDRLWLGAWTQLAFYVVPLFALEAIMRLAEGRFVYARLPFLMRYTLVVILVLANLALIAPIGQHFIYFDF
jgi:D-alanyl-lipoteichoic acid acyltransferase DltB (MBOAT superfamily)